MPNFSKTTREDELIRLKKFGIYPLSYVKQYIPRWRNQITSMPSHLAFEIRTFNFTFSKMYSLNYAALNGMLHEVKKRI